MLHTCQPEHGVPDNMSADQAKMVRDSRGMPEFIYNSRKGETMQEGFELKGNPSLKRDWWETKYPSTGENMTVAHWATTEAVPLSPGNPRGTGRRVHSPTRYAHADHSTGCHPLARVR